MKRLLSFFALSLILLANTNAYGDIARPNPVPAREGKVVLYTGLEVVPEVDGNRARLQISQQALNDLQQAMSAGTTSQSFTQRIANNPTNTIVAGLFLFMSISFAGVWLVRSSRSPNSRGARIAAAAVVSFAMLGAAVVITRANAGPPPSYLWRNLSKNLNAGRPTSGSVDVEIVSEGSGMKLIVPLKRAGSSD
jgi:hypothetical protein